MKFRLTESEMINLLEEVLLVEVMSLDNIYDTYYSDIYRGAFNKIVAADPTSKIEKGKRGKYCAWLLELYRQGKVSTDDDKLERITSYLNIVKRLNGFNINDIHSIEELHDAVEPYLNGKATSKSEEIRRIKERGAELVYEDDDWLIIVPKTKEAAIYYGSGTRWCTAATDSQNYFDHYNNRGNLYINISKKTKSKYQFHFENSEFRDSHDDRIKDPICQTVGLTSGAIKFYIKRCGNLADQIMKGIRYKKKINGLSDYIIVREDPEDTPALFKHNPQTGDNDLLYKTPDTNWRFGENAFMEHFIILFQGVVAYDIFDTRTDKFLFKNDDSIKTILVKTNSPYVICFMDDGTSRIFSLEEMDYVTPIISEDLSPLHLSMFENDYDNELFLYFSKTPVDDKAVVKTYPTFIVNINENKIIYKTYEWNFITSSYSSSRVMKLFSPDDDNSKAKILWFDGSLIDYDEFKRNEQRIMGEHRYNKTTRHGY